MTRTGQWVCAFVACGVPEGEPHLEGCPYYAECDHPGFGHEWWFYTGICPRCRKCKVIGHGPLCGDCYDAITPTHHPGGTP